ncbi:MAG TPA: histidine kinase dimerization/phosphoacceptor domain -containing protein [Spirochaetota bacterium]|nr:histidine kinase dimerization/phosphoacceptor domain -containing protein [Spirochaetota bacterium]
MPEKIWHKMKKLKLTIIIFTLIVCAFLLYYFKLSQQSVVYTHFFYVPIILSALWWNYKFLFVAIPLCAALIVPDFFIGGKNFVFQNLIRSTMFLAIGFVVAYHRIRLKKTHTLIKYRDILASIKEPVAIVDSSFNIILSNLKFKEFFPSASSAYFFKDIIAETSDSKMFFDALFSSFTGENNSLPLAITTSEGLRFFEVNFYPVLSEEKIENTIVTMWDMTSFRESEKVKNTFNERQSLIINVLELLNIHGGEPSVIKEILNLVKLHTGIDLLLIFIKGPKGFSLYECKADDESLTNEIEKGCPLINKILSSGDIYYPCFGIENPSFILDDKKNKGYYSSIENNDNYSENCFCLRKGIYKAQAVLPFFVGGDTPGFFICFSREKEFFNEDILNFLRGLVQSVAMAIERRNNEISLRQTIIEKEHLIKEVHHRVKNNMQIITSLISLQSARQSDDLARSVLNDCQNRVRIMALIQEKLYNSENFSSINFNNYIHSLVPILLSSYKIDKTKIKVTLEISDISFNITTAIPLAQLINELFTNSLKHAFPLDRSGEIHIALFYSTANQQYMLSFSDNGIGFPDGVSFPDKGNLGFQLIDAFIKQLRGKYILSLNEGVSFFISFSSLR